MKVEKYLESLQPPPGVHVELELTESAYRLLSDITTVMASRPGLSSFTLGDTLQLVMMAGTEVVSQRLAAQSQSRFQQ